LIKFRFSSPRKAADWEFDRPRRRDEDDDIVVTRPKTREPTSSSISSSSASGIGDEAQKKFGNAKAISSDQMFTGSSSDVDVSFYLHISLIIHF